MDERELLAVEREMAIQDPQYFRETVCGYMDFQPWHIQLDELWESPKRYKLLNIPRNHLKSSWIMARVLQELVRNPDLSILYEHATYKKAKDYLREMKEHIEGPRWQELFGNVQGTPWASNEIMFSTRKVPQVAASISCSGLDVSQTGKHYDIIILDDLVDDQNHKTPEGRDKAIARYKQALSLLRTGGKIIIIGTPWDRDDLYGWIKKTPEIIKLFDYLHMDVYDEQGQIRFPQKFVETTEEEIQTPGVRSLQSLRVTLGAFEFSCQYRCDPEAEAFGEFNPHWFRYAPDDVIKQSTYHRKGDIVLFCDPALGRENSKEACDVGIVGAHFRTDQVAEVFFAEGVRHSPLETVERLFHLAIQYRVNEVCVECVLFSETIADLLEKKFMKLGKNITVTRVKPQGDKERRIRSLFAYYQAGQILHAESVKGGKLEEQLTRFPKARLRDVVDAFSQFVFTRDFPVKLKAPKVEVPVARGYTMRAPKLSEIKRKKSKGDFADWNKIGK